MEVKSGANKRPITIQGIQFQVPEPFSEGHVLKANEASVLNQTFAENIRNNCATMIEEAKTKATTEGVEVDIPALQAAIDTYITQYEFGAQRGGARQVDPVMREALDIAEAKIKEQLKLKGESIKNVGAARIRELAQQLVEKFPQLLTQAKAVVEARKSVSLELEV